MPSAPGLLAEGAEAIRSQPEAEPVGARVRHRAALSAVLVIGVGVPVALAVWTGSILIPHNDAWSYSKIAQVFARTGQIHLLSWNRSALIGQVAVLGPLGRWIWVQQVAMSVLAVVGLLLAYRILARRLAPTPAVLGTALVAAFPGFGLLSTSFMADIPAFVAVVGCIAVADYALERRSTGLVGVSLLIGLLGATVREEVIAAPVAVVAAALIAFGRRRARPILSMAALGLVAMGAFEIWRTGLPHDDRPHVKLSLLACVDGTARGYLTIALLLSPALLLSGRIRRPSSLGTALSVLGAAIGIATVVHFRSTAFLGNYLAPSGAYAAADIGRRAVIPGAAMGVLIALALVAGTLLPAIVVARWRDLDPLLTVLAVLTIVGSVVELLADQLVLDRNLIVLLVPGMVICLRGPVRRRRLWRGMVPLVGLGALSFLICANALARDAAVWDEANSLVAQGVPATSIDAGLDWVGYHAGVPADRMRKRTKSELDFWEAMFPASRVCYAVTVAPLHHRTPFERVPYRTFAVWGRAYLDVYRVDSCPYLPGS
ncbi:MAG: hypothetical protein WB383_00715 [Acidimicrobiales bacterium]